MARSSRVVVVAADRDHGCRRWRHHPRCVQLRPATCAGGTRHRRDLRAAHPAGLVATRRGDAAPRRRAVRRLAARGCTGAVLWVLRDNANARRFYEAHGWSFTGEEMIEERSGFGIPETRYAITFAAASLTIAAGTGTIAQRQAWPLTDWACCSTACCSPVRCRSTTSRGIRRTAISAWWSASRCDRHSVV